ncbi:MAG: amidohydrolase [Zestosphaera sp.]
MKLRVCLALINGKIYVSFNPLRTCEALVVSGGKVIYTGSKSGALGIVELLKCYSLDLKGGTVLPGFIDAHVHLDGVGMHLNTIDLRGVRSIKELKERLGSLAEGRSSWVIGHGWDQELFREGRWPTRWDLDEVVSDRPVMLTRVCGHAAVLNTKAMEITDLFSFNSPDVLRDERGEATGVVRENALDIARHRYRETVSLEDLKESLRNAVEYAASLGITTIGFVSADEASLQALGELRSEGRLPIRVRLYLNPGREGETLKALKKLGLRHGFGDEYLKICGIKVFADGSLGARTAWLTKPYSDSPGESGYPSLSEERLENVAREAQEAGLQLAVHAIGDAAIDMVLRVYSRLSSVHMYRHRVEHASVIRPDQIVKAKELGVVLVVQPHFIITDWWVIKRVGNLRVSWVYPFRSIVNADIPMAISTDSPVEPLNPWETIYAAVSRGKLNGVELYHQTPQESLSLGEALHAYTQGSAYALGEDSILGSLEEGKLADFIVVDKDPFNIEVRELRSVKVLETYVSGVKTYSASR